MLCASYNNTKVTMKQQEQHPKTIQIKGHNFNISYKTMVINGYENYYGSAYERTIEIKKDDVLAGYFTIKINYAVSLPIDICDFQGSVPEMSILVEEPYNKLGLTKIMMRLLINQIKTECSNFMEDAGYKLLYIDTDASAGFWQHIGMVPNPHYETKNKKRNGCGYEKYITLINLYNYAFKPNFCSVMMISTQNRKPFKPNFCFLWKTNKP